MLRDLEPEPGFSMPAHPGRGGDTGTREPLERHTRLAIEMAVVRVFGVGREALGHETRGSAPTALARQVAMYLAHVACGLTLTETGRLFGRDRTTVAHACGVIEDKRDDPLFNHVLDLLEWAVPVMAVRPGRFLQQH